MCIWVGSYWSFRNLAVQRKGLWYSEHLYFAQHYLADGITQTRSQIPTAFLSSLWGDGVVELPGQNPCSICNSSVTYSKLFHLSGPKFSQKQNSNDKYNTQAVQVKLNYQQKWPSTGTANECAQKLHVIIVIYQQDPAFQNKILLCTSVCSRFCRRSVESESKDPCAMELILLVEWGYIRTPSWTWWPSQYHGACNGTWLLCGLRKTQASWYAAPLSTNFQIPKYGLNRL